MTDKHTDALEAFEIICERLPGYQNAKDIVRAYLEAAAKTVDSNEYIAYTLGVHHGKAALPPVDVESLKREILGNDNRDCLLTFAEKEHWSRCIDHLSQRGVLR